MAFEIPRRSGRHAQRPELFVQLHARFPKQDGSLGTALKACVDSYRAVHEANERFSKDESSTPGARIVKSARNARAKLAPAVDALDAALNNANEAAAQIRTKVTAAYRPASPSWAEYQLGYELRQVAAKMNAGQLAKALETAKETGDLEFLQAIAAYDARLTNCPPQLHRWARDELISIRAPDEAKTLAGLGEQIGLARQIRDELLGSVAELIDFQRAEEIETAAKTELA